MPMPGLRRLDRVGFTVPGRDDAPRRAGLDALATAIGHLHVSGVQVPEEPTASRGPAGGDRGRAWDRGHPCEKVDA